jgi:hypothetical protein
MRRTASTTRLITIVTPDAMSSPAQGLSTNTRPPSLPMAKAYSTQITAAIAVETTKGRRG